jgi:hypothetical protein
MIEPFTVLLLLYVFEYLVILLFIFLFLPVDQSIGGTDQNHMQRGLKIGMNFPMVGT